MFNIIIKVIFWIIGKIGDIILLPIMAIINTLIPNISINFNYIFDYLEKGFNYIPFFLKFLLIPPFCIQIVLIVFTTYISLIIGVRVYQFVMKVYKNFKP